MDLLQQTAWHGDPNGNTLLLDLSKGMFDALGGRKGSLLSLLRPYPPDAFRPSRPRGRSIVSKVWQSSASGFPGTLEGDGMTLGGVLLVSKDGIAFEHLESEFGDRADPEDVVQAARELVSVP
eukprot:TRINITY_DN4947_c0_g1_i1.p3 TRINITY_DN4947_c0_g1~~TRINITY_DN4947_c0_g1_i1.p3  ORF type:complete len:123 (+),score=24.67 TRINITY_DN4947_c0_g1_i1:341-709(+)